MSKSFIYCLCILEGAVVIAVELLAGQMLAPLYGATLFSWAAVIGIVITCLAFGYFTAAKIINNKSNLAGIIKKALIITAAYILLLVFTAGKLAEIIYSHSGFFVSMFITSFFICALPCFLLAMLPPILIQQLGNHKIHPGIASGRIFFISTAGAIASCFATGFFLLPQFGIVFSMKIIFLVLFFTWLFFSVKNKIILSVILLVSGFVLLKFPSEKNNNQLVKVIEKSEGINGQLLIVDAPRGRSHNFSRIMFVNRMGQTYIDKSTGDPLWSYVDYVVYVCGTKGTAPKILLLGLGGGTVANRLVNVLRAEVDAVEFDPRIAEAAKKYFNLYNHVTVTLDDARHYLNTCNKKYDFVLFDVFKGEVPPAHVLTVESLSKVKTLLNENGAVIINFNGFLNGELGTATRSVIKTVSYSFGKYQCKVLLTPEEERNRNCLIIGMKGSADLNKSIVNLSAYGKPVQFESSHLDASTINTLSDFILTDNKPVLEYLNFESGLMWRKDFYDNFTKKYLQDGITLFD